MPLVKRLIKGSTLTYQEMDDNLSYLDNKVSGSSGYITRFSGSTALTSSLLNQVSSTVFVYGSLNVSQSLTIGGSSAVTLTSPSFYIATGSVTASVSVNNYNVFNIKNGSAYYALINDNTNNTSFGGNTIPLTSTGTSNTAFGGYVLGSLTSGLKNTGVGYLSLSSITFGNNNTAIGNNTLLYVTTGSFNTAIGTNAGENLTGQRNTLVGNQTLTNSNTGSNNTVIGNTAGFNNYGNSNVFLGHQAGYNEAGSNKLYIANNSGSSPLIKGDFSTGLLQFNTSAGTQITGSLITTENIKGSSLNIETNESLFSLYPLYKELIWLDNTDNQNQFSVYLSGSNSNNQVLIQTGNKGLSIDDKLKVVSTGTQITGSLIVSGSGATFYNIITLPALSTLPTGAASGSIATSGSNGELKPYFYNGSTWTALF
jgi:hypothetical protein